MAQVDTPADRRAKVEVETLSDTVAELEAKKVLYTLGDRLAECKLTRHTNKEDRLSEGQHSLRDTVRDKG